MTASKRVNADLAILLKIPILCINLKFYLDSDLAILSIKSH